MAIDPSSINRSRNVDLDPGPTQLAPETPSGGLDKNPALSPNRMDDGAWNKQRFQLEKGGPRTSQTSQSLGPDGASGELAYAPTDVKKQVTVGPNTTLKGLAHDNGVSEKEIIRANPGKEAKLEEALNNPSQKDINKTMQGQKLNIPNPEPYSDRALHALQGGFRSTGDRDINQMNDTADRITHKENNGQPGPGASWTPQERMNFARARVDMQKEGTSLSEIVGEKALPETLTHISADLATGAVGVEGLAAATGVGLAITAAGELTTGTMSKIVSGHSDYQMARDIENLHQLVHSDPRGEGVLDANNLAQDGRFNGTLINGAGDSQPYIASLILMYKATFPNRGE